MDSGRKGSFRSSRLAKHRQPKKREKGQVKADINVTPLVDVVLVLLIIFMVVTPMLTKGIPVDLPRTVHHEEKADDNKDIIVSIGSNEDVYINADKVALEQVASRVEEEKRRHPDRAIYLKGDNRVKYGRARAVMEAINKAGFEDIQLGTDEPKEKKN